MWPDFTAADLADAVSEFHARERRFGRVSRPSPGESREGRDQRLVG